MPRPEDLTSEIPAAPRVETPSAAPDQELATASGDLAIDTATIARVLSALEPADQTTSFEHEPTAQIPLLRAEPPAGKRRAVKAPGAAQGPFIRRLVSAPIVAGVAALAVSVGGVLTLDGTTVHVEGTEITTATKAASAIGGTSASGTVSSRDAAVTRGGERQALSSAADDDDLGSAPQVTDKAELRAAANGLAARRQTALDKVTARIEVREQFLAENRWVYPLNPVVLTARYGQYGLWSRMHTGLDFNGNTGDPIYSVANGVVVSTQYDGAYGNKTVIRLEDGTEIWYCHQTSYTVAVGQEVRAGETIGYVGSTGNVTGPHLHLEVRPGGGDPVDPYAALVVNGVTP